MCMKLKAKITKEVVVIRYYNVLFYLLFESEIDDFKKQCLVSWMTVAEGMRMKQIKEWCYLQQISFKTKFIYRKDFSFRANLWNLYSYGRFKIGLMHRKIIC